MRIACTSDQHVIFDEIFGKDEPNIPKGTPCLVREYVLHSWSFRYADGTGKFTSDENNKNMKTSWRYVHPIPEILNNLPQN